MERLFPRRQICIKSYHKIETNRHLSMNLSESTSAGTLWEWRQTTTPVSITVSSPHHITGHQVLISHLYLVYLNLSFLNLTCTFCTYLIYLYLTSTYQVCYTLNVNTRYVFYLSDRLRVPARCYNNRTTPLSPAWPGTLAVASSCLRRRSTPLWWLGYSVCDINTDLDSTYKYFYPPLGWLGNYVI